MNLPPKTQPQTQSPIRRRRDKVNHPNLYQKRYLDSQEGHQKPYHNQTLFSYISEHISFLNQNRVKEIQQLKKIQKQLCCWQLNSIKQQKQSEKLLRKDKVLHCPLLKQLRIINPTIKKQTQTISLEDHISECDRLLEDINKDEMQIRYKTKRTLENPSNKFDYDKNQSFRRNRLESTKRQDIYERVLVFPTLQSNNNKRISSMLKNKFANSTSTRRYQNSQRIKRRFKQINGLSRSVDVKNHTHDLDYQYHNEYVRDNSKKNSFETNIQEQTEDCSQKDQEGSQTVFQYEKYLIGNMENLSNLKTQISQSETEEHQVSVNRNINSPCKRSRKSFSYNSELQRRNNSRMVSSASYDQQPNPFKSSFRLGKPVLDQKRPEFEL